MTYTCQLFGAMAGWSCLYGCMLGMVSPSRLLMSMAATALLGANLSLIGTSP